MKHFALRLNWCATAVIFLAVLVLALPGCSLSNRGATQGPPPSDRSRMMRKEMEEAQRARSRRSGMPTLPGPAGMPR